MDYSLVRFIGRHRDGYFSFSGSGFELSVQSLDKKSELTIVLDSHINEHDEQFINVYIDDVFYSKERLIEGINEIKLSIESSNKKICIIKVNEVYLSSLILKDIICGGIRVKSPQKSNKKCICFFGDSLTCGYGLDDFHGTGFTVKSEDFSKSFAYLTASQLDMDYYVVARSGISLALPIYQTKLFKDIYDTVDTLNKYDKVDKYDYAVINLGTNDSNALDLIPSAEKAFHLEMFKKEYISLVNKIISDNPNIKLLICYQKEHMNDEIVNKIFDIYNLVKNKYSNPIELVEFTPNTDGANFHPYYLTHIENSKKLIKAITKINK